MPSCRPGLNLRKKPSYGRENCDALHLTLVRQGRLAFRPIDVYLSLAGSLLQGWPAAALQHKTGEASREGEGWMCQPGRHSPGHVVFGTCASLPATCLSAFFELKTDDSTGCGSVANLDVYDTRWDRILASKLVHSGGIVEVRFQNEAGTRLDFRVFWFGEVPMEVKRIETWTCAS